MDEAGDPGTRGKRYFSICAFITSSKKECHKLLERQCLDFKSQFGHKIFKEIKTENISDSEMVYFLNGLKDLDYICYIGHLDTHDSNNVLNKCRGLEKKMTIVEKLLIRVIDEHPKMSRILFDKGLLNNKQLTLLKTDLKHKKAYVPNMVSRCSKNAAGFAYADLTANSIRRYLNGNKLFYDIIKDKTQLIKF